MSGTDPEPTVHSVSVAGTSHPFAVRSMLARLMQEMSDWAIAPEHRHRIELVLAEALNNVIEHACAERDGIPFSTMAQYQSPRRDIEIVDQGAPMPGGALPDPKRPPDPGSGDPVETLPEGGWGRMLIHDLADDIRYERKGCRNHLHIRMSMT